MQQHVQTKYFAYTSSVSILAREWPWLSEKVVPLRCRSLRQQLRRRHPRLPLRQRLADPGMELVIHAVVHRRRRRNAHLLHRIRHHSQCRPEESKRNDSCSYKKE